MVHVPDVRATVDWYKSIGFTVTATYGNEEGGLSFAIVRFGKTEVMFNQGGLASTEHRREVDLYVYTDNVDEFYERIKDRVEVFEKLHDTFYGMREFIIRDCNRFWITFGQQSAYGMLMDGIRDDNAETVRKALGRGGVKSESLTAALIAAMAADSLNPEIIEQLKEAGAIGPPEIDEGLLQAHTGKYRSEKGMEVTVTFRDGRLFAAPAGLESISLIAIDGNNFRPIAFD